MNLIKRILPKDYHVYFFMLILLYVYAFGFWTCMVYFMYVL